MHMTIKQARVTDEELTAAIVAIEAYLAEASAAAGAAAAADAAGPRWQAAAILATQGVPALQTPAWPAWGNIERLRRAGPGGSGIIGM